MEFMFGHIIIFQYQALCSEMRRTGGGSLNEDVFHSLTRADQLALTYLGMENAEG